MITEIQNWFIVDLYKDNTFKGNLGKVLWGIVINDEQGRFQSGDYVCTSALIEINAEEREVHTRTGSIYILNGPGEQVNLDIDQLGQISSGMSPAELKNLLPNSCILSTFF